ncbi:low temperature requirement protein A [Limosilactobacillus antri]|uniref:low temperature requirement protein A n=1 Tax=Limosilactobacillus antri TaxID=227943 RepID=UPI001F59142D|nr:low temperature requirement protein A [Limosilactobacillus antri]
MKEIVAKRVSTLELFYDLIFVYAISKITGMIHHPVAGGLPPLAYVEFMFVVVMVMQLWLYQVLYINRFGRSRVIDTAGLLINMYAMAYLANNINTEWSLTFHSFNSAVLLLVAVLLGQYLCGSGKAPLRDRDVRAFTITLSLELLAVLVGLLSGYRYGIYWCVFGGMLGFLMPLAIYHQFIPANVNFPHLLERLGLIIIISFGEALVNVTRYFTGALFRPLPLLIFVLLAAMFGSYVIQTEKLINHHQRSRGFVLMYSHVFMVLAILSMTVGLDYLADHAVSRLFVWVLITASSAGYYLCLLVNDVYRRQRSRDGFRDYCLLGALVIVGSAVSFALRSANVGLVLGFSLTSIAIFADLFVKAAAVKKKR